MSHILPVRRQWKVIDWPSVELELESSMSPFLLASTLALPSPRVNFMLASRRFESSRCTKRLPGAMHVEHPELMRTFWLCTMRGVRCAGRTVATKSARGCQMSAKYRLAALLTIMQ